jgi:predicted Zn-dependent peptidase
VSYIAHSWEKIGVPSLANFVTHKEGRFSVHVLATDKFRTRHLALKLSRPVQRETVTESAMLPYLWMEGTAQHPSALEITRYADELFGASVRTFINKRGNRHVLEVQASAPEEGTVTGAKEVIEKLEDLLLQIASDPALGDRGFLPEHVERERGLHERRIQSVFDDKITYAMERCLEEMCQGQPEGLARLGYIEDLRKVDKDRLWQVYQEILATCDVHMYVVGHVQDVQATLQRMMGKLHQAFGQGNAPDTKPVRALAIRNGDTREVVESQSVQQGKLNLGFRTGVSYGDAEYLPLLVANGILGGFPHSKLFMNVREKASLAYYASSRLDGLTGIVAVQTGIEVGNKAQAYDIILRQVEALKAGDVTDEELDFTLRGLRNQYRQVLDQPMSLTEIHFSGVLAGIHRSVEDLLDQISAVGKEDVVRAAQTLELDTVYFLNNQEVNASA